MRDPFFMVILKTDTDASGDGTDSRAAQGYVHAIKVDFAAGTAATADTTLADALGQSLVALTNSNTDDWIYPRFQATDTAGTAIAGVYVPILVTDELLLTIAQGGASVTDAVTLYVQLYTV